MVIDGTIKSSCHARIRGYILRQSCRCRFARRSRFARRGRCAPGGASPFRVWIIGVAARDRLTFRAGRTGIDSVGQPSLNGGIPRPMLSGTVAPGATNASLTTQRPGVASPFAHLCCQSLKRWFPARLCLAKLRKFVIFPGDFVVWCDPRCKTGVRAATARRIGSKARG